VQWCNFKFWAPVKNHLGPLSFPFPSLQQRSLRPRPYISVSSPSLLPLFRPPLTFLTSRPPQAGRSGECCELSQRRPGRNPGWKRQFWAPRPAPPLRGLRVIIVTPLHEYFLAGPVCFFSQHTVAYLTRCPPGAIRLLPSGRSRLQPRWKVEYPSLPPSFSSFFLSSSLLSLHFSPYPCLSPFHPFPFLKYTVPTRLCRIHFSWLPWLSRTKWIVSSG